MGSSVPHTVIRNGLITQWQHGFTHVMSCLTDLLEILEDWTVMFNRSEPCDVQKMFDTNEPFDSV